VIDEKHTGWLKEWLADRCTTDADKATADEIKRAFRDLWKVAKAAEKLIDKPPAVLEPGSRKAELKAALDNLRQRKFDAQGKLINNAIGPVP
jgi:hypothetical protein